MATSSPAASSAAASAMASAVAARTRVIFAPLARHGAGSLKSLRSAPPPAGAQLASLRLRCSRVAVFFAWAAPWLARSLVPDLDDAETARSPRCGHLHVVALLLAQERGA